MGRKKGRRRSSTPDKGKDDENQDLPDAEHAALLQHQVASLLDLCGFFDDDKVLTDNEVESRKTTPRLQLVSSLQSLIRLLEDDSSQWDDIMQRTNDESSMTIMMNQDMGSYLCRIEEVATRVREASKAYARALVKDRSEVYLLYQELEESELAAATCSTTQQQASASWITMIILVRSIALALKRHLLMEKRTLEELEQLLDVLYGSSSEKDTTMPTTNKKLLDFIKNQAMACFRREPLLLLLRANPYLQAAMDLVAEQEQQQQQETSDRSSGKLPISNRPASAVTSSRGTLCFADADDEITSCRTVKEAAAVFLLQKQQQDRAKATFLMVVGPEGSGKTHLCDMIEQSADSTISVIRPRLPIDILGDSVGETEDIICSMFGAIRGHHGRTLIILDDVEHILSLSTRQTRNESHLQSRCQTTWLTVMDSIRTSLSIGSEVLVICTSRTDAGLLTCRFDRAYHLEPPNEAERRQMIVNALGLEDSIESSLQPEHSNLIELLSSIVESTVGRSYAELSQYCRHAVQAAVQSGDTPVSPDFHLRVLKFLETRLLSITPASLRNGVLDDFVDMRVLGAKDLGSPATENAGSYDFPLLGETAAKAWKELKTSIVIPLCQARELHDLIDSTSSARRRVVAGGVLLTGPTGSGKNMISLQCARYAACLLPTVKLVEVSCTSLIHKEVGGSERAIHHLFDSARRAAPCILLLDGIENVAAVRGNDPTTEGTLDRVLSTMLIELDGVEDYITSSKQPGGIAVIGITRHENMIDPALKRPGRLGKVIRLDLIW